MRRLIPLATLIIAFSSLALAQTPDTPSAAASWKRFTISSERVSVEFPRLPTRNDWEDLCSQTKRSDLYSYSQGTVYEVIIVRKVKKSVPDSCLDRSGFSEQSIKDRFAALRLGSPGLLTTSKVASREATVFELGRSTHNIRRWFIVEPEKNGWVEIAIHSRKNAPVQEARFLASLRFASDEGQEIGDGAVSTLGDIAEPEDSASNKLQPPTSSTISNTEAPQSDALVIVTSPRARYTEAARETNTQGSVLVKTTLLANGSIGNVQVVRGLENGLTEKAVDAAKKIVFLPKRVNGVPVTVVKTMEYTFSIY